jgi:hypothetical protein
MGLDLRSAHPSGRPRAYDPPACGAARRSGSAALGRQSRGRPRWGLWLAAPARGRLAALLLSAVGLRASVTRSRSRSLG